MLSISEKILYKNRSLDKCKKFPSLKIQVLRQCFKVFLIITRNVQALEVWICVNDSNCIQLQLYNWFTIPVASTCLKLTKYTLEQHILCCSWFYHVKFEHVNVYRDITSAVLLKSFVLTFSRSFIHITLIHTLWQLKAQLYFYDIFNN